MILDTETTDFDGDILEISISAASTGAALLDFPVHAHIPICASAPTWPQL